MSISSEPVGLKLPPTAEARLPFYYGWVCVVVAALAMVATLPGRTHGLGYITKPLLKDLQISDVDYSTMNFWAILIGSVFCWPVGRLLDRLGTRSVLTAVSLILSLLVILMSQVGNALTLFLLLVLIRGLGQGALSVVSIAVVGKWFRRRLGIAMAVYSILLGLGFTAAPRLLIPAVATYGWRSAWAGVGASLLFVMAPLAWLLVRNTPEECGVTPDPEPLTETAADVPDAGFGQALATPAFWIFTLAMSLFGLITSAFTLFPQAILEEHGFDVDVFMEGMTLMAACGLATKLPCGWLATRWPHGRLLGLAMLLLAATLAALPEIFTRTGILLYAGLQGVAGAAITLIFFSFYGRAYGRKNLGQIMGAAQVLSVFASALGPVLLTMCKVRYDSYDMFFYVSAPLAAVLGISAWLAPTARPALAPEGGK